MILSLLVIAVSLGLGYIWLSRGFFSALLNLICVIVAGAIAFGFWEPLSQMLASSAPMKGLFGFVGSGAWAIGLLLPFAVSLALLRTVTDTIVRANTKVPNIVDMVGGAACGLASGVIIMGFVVIGGSFARLPTNVFGFQPVDVDRGNVVRTQKLLLPADKLVVAMYTHLSAGPLRSGDQLGYWYPDLATAGWQGRMNHGGGKAVSVLNPKQFTVLGRYTVAEGSPLAPAQLFGPDVWYTNAQQVTDPDGNPLVGQYYIEGYKVEFDPSARESFGQVVVSPGQARLLIERPDGTTYESHPVALVSIADAAQSQYARFRFMSRDAITSSGAGDVTMGIEFPVKSGDKPVALYLKNCRVDVRNEQVVSAFPTPELRNASIQTGQLMGGVNVLENLDKSDAVIVDPTNGNVVGFDASIPGRRVLQEGQEDGLKIDDDNRIYGGQATLDPNSFQRSGTITKELRIAEFALPPGTGLAKIDVGADSPASIANEVDAIAKLTPEQRRDAPPVLIDARGATYSAVGYVYEDKQKIIIRYEPGNPVASLEELRRQGIEVSRNNPGQKLTLIFLTTAGVDIEMMAIGQTVTAEFEPAFQTLEQGKRR